MKCVLFGGAGFIGSHLAQRLIEAGHAVRIFDRPDWTAHRGFPCVEEIEWYEGDFVNRRDTAQALAGCEAAFHLVSTTLPATANENPVYDVETNILGTLRMLEGACAAQLKKIVFVSSGGTVYGVPREIPIAETHPTDPITAYGVSKLMVEKYLELYRVLHGLEYVVLRVSNPYGERRRLPAVQGVVSAFMHRALARAPIEVWGDGSVVRDYLYVGDVAQALVRALDHGGDERIFNIGSGVGRTVNDIIDAIEKTVGWPLERRYLARRAFDVPANVLDISRARRALAWEPCTPFDEGLDRTLAWFRQSLG
jgi:UDP-glucose 4-epimerase